MLGSMRLIGAAAGVALASYATAADITIREHLSNDTLLTLGTYSFEGGKTLNLTVGIGSGAFRGPNDPGNVIWTIGDRGPNFTCGEAKNVSGVTPKTCGEVKNGRVYPVPAYSPSIYRMMLLDDATFRVTDVITLKDRDGRPLNGMPNPLKVATTETPLDGTGKQLQQDVHGIDAEGIVRLSDGTFWIGDENGPSMAYFSAEGRMIARHVPRGTEGDYAGARYEVVGSLPAILAKRQANRGIESMAISPDERFLYFIVQNPLANPDAAAFRQARNVRLFKIERATMKIAGEYVYVMDDPRSFRRDPSDVNSDPRISELMAVGLDRLIVLERTEQTTKLHEIELTGATDISGSKWDDDGDQAHAGAERRRGGRHHAGQENAPLRHCRVPQDRRQDRGHGAARRWRPRDHQRRRLRHFRRAHADRTGARNRHRAALTISRLACRRIGTHSTAMPPYVPKYVRPEDAAQSRAQLIRRLIWIAAAIPLLFMFFAFAYSDQAPTGLRNAVIALDRSLGFPIIGLLGMILG